MARLALGLDSSTQSLSSVIVDIDNAEKIYEHSLDYRQDERLNDYGIGSDYVLPPRIEGEADQPPEMFLASLDAMFCDIRSAGVLIEDIVVINNSAQQHSHTYLNSLAKNIFSQLHEHESAQKNLADILRGSFSYLTAPIWMTSNTVDQASSVREDVGGKDAIIHLSGSNAPLRFTGAIIRRVAEQFPEAYQATENVQLVSSLIPAVLTGNSKVPVDYGNACGTSLMDYRKKDWSPELLKATAKGLPGGSESLLKKLPRLVSPDTLVGNIAAYFIAKYGFRPGCKVMAGSGDNPQAKVLVVGDLLSLGTSFVSMVSTENNVLDWKGLANAMYDGIGRPFMFGCRTNGAMVWDAVRALYGLNKTDYNSAEEALKRVEPGHSMVFWQPTNESFPPSGSFDMIRIGPQSDSWLGSDYAGIIETSLAAVYVNSADFMKNDDTSLYVTGGATESPQIMKRVAAIWNRRVVPIEKAGPALGAAVAGTYAYYKYHNEPFIIEDFRREILKRNVPILPQPPHISIYHGQKQYLEKFRTKQARILENHPI